MGLIIPYFSFIFCNTLNWYVSWYIFDQVFAVFCTSLKVQVIKKKICNMRALGLIPGEGEGYPLQYSGLENSMDCSPWGCKELDTTEWLTFSISCLWGFFFYRFRHQLQTILLLLFQFIYFSFLIVLAGLLVLYWIEWWRSPPYLVLIFLCIIIALCDIGCVAAIYGLFHT